MAMDLVGKVLAKSLGRSCGVALAVLSLVAGAAPAATIVQGTLFELEPGAGNTVDLWSFTASSSGIVTIDLLSYENHGAVSEGAPAGADSDVNGDAEFAYFDPKIYLFDGSGGSIDLEDVLAANDDDDLLLGTADGSIDDIDGGDSFDSYLSLNLAAGDYVVSVGTFNAFYDALDGDGDEIVDEEVLAHLAGSVSAGSLPTLFGPGGVAGDHGDYQITFGGDVTVASVPEPGTLALVSLGLAALALGGRRRDAER